MSAKTKNPMQPNKDGWLKEMVMIVVQALLIAVVITTFLIQPFVIPSGSMRPTLLVGDYLFVSKFSYGYSRFSIPYAPNLFSGRIWGTEPKRGDVAVFRPPNDLNNNFIKRVIGLPGDRIQMRQGVLYINDKPVQRELVGRMDNPDIVGKIRNLDAENVNPIVSFYRETLDNGVQYNTLDIGYYPRVDDTRVYEVPEGYYFMMGDNRDDSDDSRLSVGYVPFENFIGRANILFFSIGNDSKAWQIWRWPFDIRWDRIFSSVRTIHYFPPNG